MKSRYVTVYFLFFLFTFSLYANALKGETSPYLLQHADNPVDWMPWGEKAFQKAKKENKALFISIGYSTCHWCHVMEEESFCDPKTAALINRYFIPVKVDREEMPQIDSLYQQRYKQYYGAFGGWPLNLFITPQKELFFITNYIPAKTMANHKGFDTLLLYLHQIYKNRSKLQKSIQKFEHTKKRTSLKHRKVEFSLEMLEHAILQNYQKEYCGFGKSREFPEAAKLTLMFDVAQLRSNKVLMKNYFDMLDIMALRGLYDQVNGGFFRYTVDVNWEIPHFEKMLYTQAELIPLYLKAYILTKKPLYKDVIDETIRMLKSRFQKDSLYWSASDADSQGKEGGFFTFTQEEIKRALKDNPNAKDIEDAMEFSYEGNFHDRVHINFYTNKRPKGFIKFQKALQKLVQKRSYPFIDKKINTAWNAMMIEALYKASVINQKYLKEANRDLLALTQMMFDKGILYHQTLMPYQPQQKGLLEDYAFFIGALISAYERDFDKKHLEFANYLLSKAKEKFYKEGIWYLSEKQEIQADLNDKYYTSALSKMIQDIVQMAALEASFEYEKLAQRSIKSFEMQLKEDPLDVPALTRAYLMQQGGVVVLKSNKENLQKSTPILLKDIKYPYTLMKAKTLDDYLACTLRQCFAKEIDLHAIIKKINFYKKEIGKK